MLHNEGILRKRIARSAFPALLRSRAELEETGHGDRDIRGLLAAGSLIRLRRDRYVAAADYGTLWAEDRHLLHVIATARNVPAPGPVFFGPSAAVLHALPLYRVDPSRVHTVITGAKHGRTRAGVMQHAIPVKTQDIVEIDGLRCTSLDRTILDLACGAASEIALSAADAAQRRETVRGQRFDGERAAAWHARMSQRADAVSFHGIKKARWILSFADGRAQLPGESVSRLHLHRLGYRDVQLQVPVTGSEGDTYWMDFAFPRARFFGEFDGRAKYFDDELRAGRTADDVVWAEKRREDDVRGVTGWRIGRWDHTHISAAETLGQRLSAFGIRPPG